jgi:hypothetical protein
MSDISVWQTEKLPLDVLSKIFLYLLDRKCSVCEKTLPQEFRRGSMVAVQLICRRWRLGWSKCIVAAIRKECSTVCWRPQTCLMKYVQNAPALPFIYSDRLERRVWTDVLERLEVNGL